MRCRKVRVFSASGEKDKYVVFIKRVITQWFWLVKNMNEKSMLPESKAGFRRGRGAVDNVFILHDLGGCVHCLSTLKRCLKRWTESVCGNE